MNLDQLSAEAGFLFLREGPRWRVFRHPSKVVTAHDVQSLEALLAEVDRHIQAGGEAAGLLRYEAGYAFEPRLTPLISRSLLPLAWFGLYSGSETIDDFDVSGTAPAITDGPMAEITREAYCENVETIRSLIEAGDVYQINLTYPLRFRVHGTAWDLFRSLLRGHPTDYAAYINTGAEQIVSLSPELFFRIEEGHMVVRPMKGTAARGLSSEEDRKKPAYLLESEKERAENLMITDLMRNDLGRICRTGSVETTELFRVEKLPSVWQMTSTVAGELPEEWKISTVLRALFPPGSVTGAPKLRAMECIADLEPRPRGAYTGILGYVTGGQAQFSVAIRTIELQKEEATMGVGSGITWDSAASAEWEECAWKAAFIRHQPREFAIFETLRWEDGYKFPDEHIARMFASAEYFDFPLKEYDLRKILADTAVMFDPGICRRVRIAVSADGELRIAHSEFSSEPFGRVRLAAQTVSSGDLFLYHKTTMRSLYDKEYEGAQAEKCDDALFLNERGELTEGCIHNVFVVKDGVWYTPPLRCGLLPGIYRAHYLAEHPDVREAVLTAKDLRESDAVCLCNSVRGMYRTKLV